uniref:N4BP1 C-terminal UBA domain-containing protein n=1 Tax=Micrurus surinamensis TaxID=129470 RepID=A0A2D4P3Q0_MICSU
MVGHLRWTRLFVYQSKTLMLNAVLFFSRARPTPYSLASGSHLPFLMQSEWGGQLLPNPVSGLVPNLPQFPTTSLLNSGPLPSPRSATETAHLKEALKKIFPTSEQEEKIEEILAQHPHMRDMNALSALVLDLS